MKKKSEGKEPNHKMKRGVSAFPFRITNVQSRNLSFYNKWIAANGDMLDREYGSMIFTGNREYDRHPHFSYYEADLEMTGTTTGMISFYGLRSFVGGVRGELLCKVEATFEFDGSLGKVIHSRKMQLAEIEFDRREEARLAAIRKLHIANVYEEMFSVWPEK